MCTTRSGPSSLSPRTVMVSRQLILSVAAFALLLCVLAHVVASAWTEDTQRSDQCLASVSPSEMLLSVEPVMLTKAPCDLSQEDPQPSTSGSRLCIGSQSVHSPGAPGTFSLYFSAFENNVSLLENSTAALWRLTVSMGAVDDWDQSYFNLTKSNSLCWIY